MIKVKYKKVFKFCITGEILSFKYMLKGADWSEMFEMVQSAYEIYKDMKEGPFSSDIIIDILYTHRPLTLCNYNKKSYIWKTPKLLYSSWG